MAALFERKKAIAVTGAVLVLWFALNLIINLLEVFGPTTPDLYVYLAILIPAALLAASYVGVAGFRRFLLSIDLRLLIMVQGWRVVGAVFFFLYAFNVAAQGVGLSSSLRRHRNWCNRASFCYGPYHWQVIPQTGLHCMEPSRDSRHSWDWRSASL